MSVLNKSAYGQVKQRVGAMEKQIQRKEEDLTALKKRFSLYKNIKERYEEQERNELQMKKCVEELNREAEELGLPIKKKKTNSEKPPDTEVHEEVVEEIPLWGEEDGY